MSVLESFVDRFTRLAAAWRKPKTWPHSWAELVASHAGVDHALDYTFDQASKIAQAFKKNPNTEELPPAEALPKGLVIYGHGCGSGGLTRAIAKELNAHFITGTTCHPDGVAGGPTIAHYFGQARELARHAASGQTVLLFLSGANNLTSAAPHLVPAAAATNAEIAKQLAKLTQTSGVLVVIEAETLGQIDATLLADGLFEVQIEVEKPDYKGRLAIFQNHLAGKSHNSEGKSSQQQLSVQIFVFLDGALEDARSFELNEICQECAVLSNGLHADQIYRALYLLRSQAATSGSITAEQLYQAIETQQGKP